MEIIDIKKFELLSGETLVVRVDTGRIHPNGMRAFREKFELLFPNNKLLLMPSLMEISSIIKEKEG